MIWMHNHNSKHNCANRILKSGDDKLEDQFECFQYQLCCDLSRTVLYIFHIFSNKALSHWLCI